MFESITFGVLKKYSDMSDSQLIFSLQKGDNKAFEQLYLRYKDKIYSYIWTILNYNEQESLAVCSDVFIKVYHYLKSQKVDNFKSFLYRVSHNESVNFLANKKAQFINIQDDIVENIQENGIGEGINSKYKNNIVQGILSSLGENYRQALYLYYFEQLDYQQIAHIMGTNKNTVGTLISRAKKQFEHIANQNGYIDALIE